MKFLVLALCVYAASGASFNAPAIGATFKPWQFRSEPQKFGQAQAYAKAEVAPQVFEQPAVKFVEPIVKAVPTPVYSAPVAVAKSAVYSPAGLAKNVYADKEANAAIISVKSDVAADSFNYAYETENGIAAQSSGILKNVDNTPALAIQGSYQYVAPDGQLIKFSYIADENGYQPQSDILPVGPAIPEEITRSLKYISAHSASIKPEINYN